MTTRDEQQDSSGTALTSALAPEASGRKPYQKPALRRLGSVRELTLGSPIAGATDGRGGRRRLM